MDRPAPPPSRFAPWDDPEAAPLLRLRGVSKLFGEFSAIENLSLDVYDREFFALLGPSGCGKTTLMRMLAGFEVPSSGQIELAGKDLLSVPVNRRPTNMMFQSYALFPHLSVEANIAFGLRQQGKRRDEIASQVADMLALTQLEPFARRKPHQLSGGQRQRVALARSLARRPRLLLLDEPLAALDKKLREETQFELMNIQEQLGITFIIVTHDQNEAMTVASRIAVMRQGRIEQIATPDLIYEQPSSRFVADFIGDVNLLPILLKDEGEDLWYAQYADWGEGQPPLVFRKRASDGLKRGQQAWLVLRPEKLGIAKQPPLASANRLQGKVVDIAYSGNLSTYHVALSDNLQIKVQRANRQPLDRREITWDDPVWVFWDASSGLVVEA